MIRVTLYQNNNAQNTQAYGKWYPRAVAEETIGLDELSEHMASHNTPFSKGAIKGILTDAVVCTKELLLLGKNVKFPDLAIFSIGLKVKGGAETKEDFSVAKFITGLRLRARATGKLSSSNLDTSIKRVDATTQSASSSGTTDKGNSGTSSGGSSSGGSSSGSGGSSSGGSGTGGSSTPGTGGSDTGGEGESD